MNLTARLAPLADVRHLLNRAVPYAVDGSDLAALTDGCATFAMHAPDGRIVGAFALQCLTDDRGTVIHVTAAGGLPGFDLAGDMAAFCEDEARGHVKARAVRCVTRRPGLVKRLKKAGYRVAGYLMEKEI